MEQFFNDYWMLLIPVLIIQVGLLIAALIDLVRRDNVTGNNKIIWGIFIVVVSYIGPILYFVIGRKEN